MTNLYHYLTISFIILFFWLPSKAQDSKDTISIIAFNDFHGRFIPDKGVPGAACLVGAVNTLRATKPNPIVVSGGDNFSGDIYSLYTRAHLIKMMYDRMKVEVSAIGNHEFDWGLPFLKDTLSAIMPLISANVTDAYAIPEHPWFKPYRIVERTLKDGKTFRIAFIGITTTTTADKTKAANLRGITFSDPLGAVQRQAIKLQKEENVDMIVLVIHTGINMGQKLFFNDSNTELLPFVPHVDAIVSGHVHTLGYDKVNNVPVIQAEAYSVGVNALYFQVRNHKGMRDISYLGMDTLQTRNFTPDKEMKIAIESETSKYGFNEKLTYSHDDMIHSADINPHTFTYPGSYVSASYAYAYKKKHPDEKPPVIGGNHFGGIRESFYKGTVTYLHALNMLPFSGKVIAYRFTGNTLKQLLTKGRQLPRYFQTADITIHITKQNMVDRVWYAGKEILPDDDCIVVVDSYIADGSDGFDANLFKRPIEVVGKTSDLFASYLRTLPSISMRKAPLPIVKRN
jgi:2',3'-cyclic-nucleotide 2'-phosphodiesterase (5'-nucleotidase family)